MPSNGASSSNEHHSPCNENPTDEGSSARSRRERGVLAAWLTRSWRERGVLGLCLADHVSFTSSKGDAVAETR